MEKRDAEIQLFLLSGAVSFSSQLSPVSQQADQAQGEEARASDPEGEGKAAAVGTEGPCKLWKAEMSQGMNNMVRGDPRGGQKESGLEFTSFGNIKQYLQMHFPSIRKGVWCSRILAEFTGQQIPRHSSDYTDAQDFPSRCLSPAW